MHLMYNIGSGPYDIRPSLKRVSIRRTTLSARSLAPKRPSFANRPQALTTTLQLTILGSNDFSSTLFKYKSSTRLNIRSHCVALSQVFCCAYASINEVKLCMLGSKLPLSDMRWINCSARSGPYSIPLFAHAVITTLNVSIPILLWWLLSASDCSCCKVARASLNIRSAR